MDSFVFPKIKEAGIFDSTIAYKGLTVSSPRVLTCFQLELPLENGGRFYIDDDNYDIHVGTLVCTKPGQIRHTLLPLRCLYIHIIPTQGIICDFLTSLPVIMSVQNYQELFRLFSDINFAYTFPPPSGSEFLIASKILDLLYAIHHEQSRMSVPTINTPLLKNAISYIDAHYLNAITVEDVAREVNVSHIHFHRVFLAATGSTPHQYILLKKLEYSKVLLITTMHSLSEVANMAGFSSQSHFGSAFKKQYNKTPLQYRKEMLSATI